MRTLVTLGVLAVATTLLGRRFGLHDARFLGSEIALLIGMFVIVRYVLPLVDRHDRGAKGEEQVGGLLQSMSGDGWLLIHDVSFGHGNVDHIAIGPGGVFTIETKSHPGPVRVGRIHGATLRQAQSQQKLIAKLTGETVQPLIVFSRAWVDRPLSRRKGVRVLPARMLVGYLRQRKRVLDTERIDRANRQIVDALASHSLTVRGPARGQSLRAANIRRPHLPRQPRV
jgi:hypothetical protein